MPSRGSCHCPGMTVLLHVEQCRGCGRRGGWALHDVRPSAIMFACPHCRQEVSLRMEQLIVLVKRDRARLHLAPLRFVLEGLASSVFERLDVSSGIRLRLHHPRCASCGHPESYWLKDVYDSGPLFCCPEEPEQEWHLHLDHLRLMALAERVHLGGLVPSHLLSREALLPAVDRRQEEALGALREESLRRGYHPRELPWGG